MRRLFFAILTCSPLWADNSVTIKSIGNATLIDYPFSISRVFAKGEIPEYAQPEIGNTPLTFWQCDRKTMWADGSIQHAIISFRATITPAGLTVAFANSANPSSAGDSYATSA